MISAPVKLLFVGVAALAFSSGNVRHVEVVPFVGAAKLRLKQTERSGTNNGKSGRMSEITDHCSSESDKKVNETNNCKEDWMSGMIQTADSALGNLLWFFGLKRVSLSDDTLVRNQVFKSKRQGVDVELLQRYDGKWVLTFEGEENEKNQMVTDLQKNLSQQGVQEGEKLSVKVVKDGQVVREVLGWYLNSKDAINLAKDLKHGQDLEREAERTGKTIYTIEHERAKALEKDFYAGTYY